jgi:hypothetical protein
MMRRDPGPAAGKRLLFWDDQGGAELQPLLDLLGVVPGGRKYGQPKDHVRQDVPWADREELGRALQLRTTMNPMGGDILMSYMGWADCRICGERLGTSDFFGHGFMWPEKADHYVLIHKVWTKECDEMLAAVRHARRRAP